MKIHVSPRHITLTEAIEAAVVTQLKPLEQLAHDIDAAHVVLDTHDTVTPESRFTVSVRLSVAGPDVHAEVHGDNLYTALGAVTEKLGRQLRKRKTRLTDKRRQVAQRASERDRRALA